MSRKKLAIRGYIAVFTATALSIAAIALIATGALNPATYFAGRYQKELTAAPDDEVRFNLHRIAKLGDAGVPILVEALASNRPIVSETAHQVLKDQLGRWQLESESRSTKKIALLAESLAKHVDSFGSTARIAAGELTTEVLIWPVNTKYVDNGRLIANCEIVLRAVAERPVEHVASNPNSRIAKPRETPANRSPTSNLPAEIVRIPSFSASQRPVTVVDSFRDPDSPIPPAEFPVENLNAGPNPLVPEPKVVENPPANRMRQVETPPLGPTAVAINQLDDLGLMRRLRLTNANQAYAAAEELENRGYTADDLHLALQLTSPDTKQRVALVQLLPQLTGVDSRKWLVWLSYDESAEVRREAVTVLATSEDPKIQTHLRRIAERESDPEVLRRIQRR